MMRRSGLDEHPLKGLFLGTSAMAIAFMCMPDVARAQADEDTESINDIVVTGSRIARRDYEANSPIVTANEELLQQTSNIGLEQNLNKLPQFTPAQAPTQGGDIQATATSTPGAATVSLRGIGANRNLVLLDGRRATPANANMVVDLNTIPQAAIDRIEIITGGASATYGADAVGGVVNLILKKNFQGLDVNAQMGITERGDAQEYRISAFMGTNFSDGRGNITIGLERANRDDALRRDRDWQRRFWADPNRSSGTVFFTDFATFVPAGNNPDQAVVNALFAGRPTGTNYPNTANYYFNYSRDGSGLDNRVFGGIDARTIPGAYRFEGALDGTRFKQAATGQIYQNAIDEYLVLPLQRWNVYARGHYEINDWVTAIAQAYFNKSSSETRTQGPSIVNGWGSLIPFDDRPIPDELRTLLESRPDPTADYQLNLTIPGLFREVHSDVYTFQMLAGLQGKIPGMDWTWEAYGSHGETSTNTRLSGALSLQRWRTIIAAPNWGAGFVGSGNEEQGGFGAAQATCTSGLNPFDDVPISQDCMDAISADIKNRSVVVQSIWEGTAQGGLFDLPAGQVRAAVGIDHRRTRFTFQNDTLTTQGTSFLDQAIGIYPSGNSEGAIGVTEFYGELLVPLLADLPAIRKLELELGARYSDYTTTGGSWTYKLLGNWEVTHFLRIRGGYNRAERAPNIAELFQARQQIFSSAPGGDLCSTNNLQPFSAGTGNTTNRAAVRTLCEQIMNRNDPTGQTSVNFYENASNQVAGSQTVFLSSQGNPDLTPEVAKTWTVGAVIDAPFQSPWLRHLRLSVDYYNIKVQNAIGLQTADIIQRQCFDTAFNPTLDPNAPACLAVIRNNNIGTIGDLRGTYLNSGRFRVKGIDAQLDWGLDMEDAGIGLPGRFNVNVVLNYLDSVKSSVLPVLPLTEYAGTYGPTTGENGLSATSYRWRTFSTFSWSHEGLNIGLQWQHLPKIRSLTAARNPDTTIVGAPAYDLFNLFGSIAVTDNATFRFGIDNLFDRDPPVYEYNPEPPAGQLIGGSIGAPGGTQAPFFDVLGRRYYLGLKVRL